MVLKSHHWSNAEVPQKTILFLHGMGGTGALWRPIAAGLEDHYNVYAFDQRGHGESRAQDAQIDARSKPEYTPLAYGRDVVETLLTLNITETWIVGHSMGVRTACATAHLAPDQVTGLVLIDLGFAGMAGGGLGAGLAQFIKLLPQSFESREEARAFMTARCPDPAIAQYLMAVSQTSQDKRVTFPFDHGALIETIHASRDSSVRKWVEEFLERGKPVLVLRGEKSLVWSRADFLAEQAHFSRWPNAAFEETVGAGHGLPFEKRAEFVARLKILLSNA